MVQRRWFIFGLLVLIMSACGGSKATPEGVVQAAIEARARGDKRAFNEMVIAGREWLWDKIVNCENQNPKFSLRVEQVQDQGVSETVVQVYDGRVENGGFVVIDVAGK